MWDEREGVAGVRQVCRTGAASSMKASPPVRLFKFVLRAGHAVVRWTCKTFMAIVMTLVSFLTLS